MNESLTDAEVVANLKAQRDMDATLRFLYRHHFEPLARYVTLNGGSATDAEDIFQEVVVAFVYLVQGEKFRGESSIRTFLYALNRNTWLNELKRRGRAARREQRWEALHPHSERSIGQVMESREATGQLLRVIGELGEACRSILVKFYYENKTMREILAELDYGSEQVVRNKKYKCLRRLEELLQARPALAQQLNTLLHE
ncbi:MAG TPA: sigma-70 family RNA polymerase sigma factor [Chitinophagaceae bacterium]|jgi:RNA polymerase sigma factor (sigma-70 family)|nr:sigma-70 family RNA polymerase sigma factor [Chitinophagaceae bacterium]